jgi:hypothetical protein
MLFARQAALGQYDSPLPVASRYNSLRAFAVLVMNTYLKAALPEEHYLIHASTVNQRRAVRFRLANAVHLLLAVQGGCQAMCHADTGSFAPCTHGARHVLFTSFLLGDTFTASSLFIGAHSLSL